MSNDLYLDQIKKINYYKQKIVDDYVKKGKVIDKIALDAKLEEINTKLAVFSENYIRNGSELDVDTFNRQKNDIYADLCILYETLFELAEDRLSKLEHKIDCELARLDVIAKKYRNRSRLETLAIYGNSIYYSTNGFDQYYKDGKVYVNLGSMTIPGGSYLACICDCYEIENKDITFQFNDQYRIADYMYGKKYLKIAGNYNITTDYFSAESVKNSSFEIARDNISKSSTYNIFAGEGKIKVYHYDTLETEYVDKLSNISYVAKDSCQISFYIYGASEIKINAQGTATYSSFDQNTINSPKYRQKILVTCEPGYKLDFYTDGKLFAEKAACTVTGGKLFSPHGLHSLTDYMLEEITYGDMQFDNVQVIIDNAESSFFDIDYIAIKQVQISELESGLD